jgi:hypothetical protein
MFRRSLYTQLYIANIDHLIVQLEMNGPLYLECITFSQYRGYCFPDADKN